MAALISVLSPGGLQGMLSGRHRVKHLANPVNTNTSEMI
jgi:hypothetical protein